MEVAVKKKRDTLFLDEVLLENELVVIDNCAIDSCIKRGITDRHQDTSYYESQKELVEMMEDYHERFGNIFLTEGVFKEANPRGGFPYKKLLKTARIQSDKHYRDALMLRNEALKIRKRFVKRLKAEGRILDEETNPQMENFLRSISKDFKRRYNLSKVDYDLLIAVATRTAEGGRIGLISSDFGIIRGLTTLNSRAGIKEIDIAHSMNVYYSETHGIYVRANIEHQL